MAALRIVRATTGTTFNSVAIAGVVQAGWALAPTRKRGRSDGEIGDTSIDKTFHRITGFVEVDNYDGQPESLLTGVAHPLVIAWIAAGGTAKTTTIDNVLFTGTGPTRIAEGSEDGNTSRTRVNFVGLFAGGDATVSALFAVA